MRYPLLFAFSVILLAGCSATVTTPARAPIDGAGLATSLQASGLPVDQVQVWTAETDPNKLLGRPNQYTNKVSWFDTRVKATDALSSATVESFATASDLQARYTYTDTISKSGGAFSQYIYRNDDRLLLLRLPHELTPDQAQAYKSWLDAL